MAGHGTQLARSQFRHPMHYLFASESVGERASLFARFTEEVGAGGQLKIYRSVSELSARLRQQNRPEIIVLLLSDSRDLASLNADRELLVEADVILLVQDDGEDTTSAAHSLRPRYLGRIDGDLDTVISVFRNLLRRRLRELESRGDPAVASRRGRPGEEKE